MNQTTLAEKLGLKSAQTVSAIENGEREVTSEELVHLGRIFKKEVDFFVDPTLLVGEGKFSWRATAEPETLDSYETNASRWIAAWREASRLQSKRCVPFSESIPLDNRSLYEDAWEAAEEIVEEWQLGPYPAENLASQVEQKLNILVLYVDTPHGISGAACWIKEFGTILIDREEGEGRRNFDLAHELFHLLTWQAMPPSRIEQITMNPTRRSRVEALADNFAGALLMPRRSVQAAYAQRGDRTLPEWLVATAPIFKVSVSALYWRLVALGMVQNNCGAEIERLPWKGESRKVQNLFSKKFVDLLYEAVEAGHMSLSYVGKLLGIGRDGLKDLFHSYGLDREGIPSK